MKRRLLLLAGVTICALTVTVSTAGQSVDELITKNLEAKGGLAKLKSIQSIKQTANLKMQGMDAAMTVYAKRPNRLRQEMKMGSQMVVNGFDGVTAWMINPVATGSSRPIAVSGPQADMLREQGDFEGPLVDYKVKGFTVAIVGPETIGDRKVQHLRLVSQSQQVIHIYLDASTFLEVKRATEVERLKLEQELTDYRTVDGVTVPFTIRMLTNGVPMGEIRVQSVEFNVAMDDAIFRMPKG